MHGLSIDGLKARKCLHRVHNNNNTEPATCFCKFIESDHFLLVNSIENATLHFLLAQKYGYGNARGTQQSEVRICGRS